MSSMEPYYERDGIKIYVGDKSRDSGLLGIIGLRNEAADAVLETPVGVTWKVEATMQSKNTPFRRTTNTDKAGRKQALRMYPVIGPCADCGAVDSERHHIDGDPTNNAPDNITPLCRSCHARRHVEVPEFREAVLKNLEVAKARRWANRIDTNYRPGDVCPSCGKRLGVTATRHRNGYTFTYIGCRKSRGGCGAALGSIKEASNG